MPAWRHYTSPAENVNPGLYYVARSGNRKTGNIPQQFIGATREESLKTCRGCPLLEKICYAQNRITAKVSHRLIIKRSPYRDYSLRSALKHRNKHARYVRFAAIGDPSAIDPEMYRAHEEMIRSHGLGVLSYTHFWKSRGKHLKGAALASCDTWQEAEEAVNAGWRASLHVESLERPSGKTSTGKRYLLCPEQRTQGKIKCNDCGLCDPKRRSVDIIVFLNH